MTNEEQFLEKYGDVKVKFSSYYKFMFTYSGVTEDGVKISASIGGNSDGIYKREVVPDEEIAVKNLWPVSGEARSPDGVELLSFWNY